MHIVGPDFPELEPGSGPSSLAMPESMDQSVVEATDKPTSWFRWFRLPAISLGIWGATKSGGGDQPQALPGLLGPNGLIGWFLHEGRFFHVLLALLFVGYTGGSDTGVGTIEDYMEAYDGPIGGDNGELTDPSQSVIPGSRVMVLRSRADWHAFLVEALDPNPAVVCFTAKWCENCKRMDPLFKELSNTYPDIAFRKVDIEENSKAATNVAIRDVPYFMFFVDGALVSHHSGANPRLLKQTLLELDQGLL